MSQPIVECIANYSEARRPEVIEQIAGSIMSVPGARILDRHSDLDHNRSVITFIGSPEAIEEAAFQSIKKAAELIDLNHHQGEHPRIGATDVVPFVPISGVTMPDCVAIANRLGKRVGDELGIPVYLYEQAAKTPERQNLENIRRGQYETLKVEIGTHPDRLPDYGPAQLGPAGATVIGARHPLIAFNVYLTTADVTIASQIARVVRNSSGGLRYVKALGLLVDGRAQVSMNLTNYQSTSVAHVVEMIRREAGRFGTAIHHCELVGLIPEEALVDAAVWYLQLDQFIPEQILERKLYSPEDLRAPEEVETIEASDAFLDRLAAGSATPGGGAAAAYTAAEAAALVAMVARLTIGKKKYADVEGLMQVTVDEVEKLRTELTTAVKADSDAFDQVMGAYKLPKETATQEEERNSAIEKALFIASHVPLEVAQKTFRILELAERVVSAGNLQTICDGGTAAALAQAAIESALLNVRVNLKTMKNQMEVGALRKETSRLERLAGEIGPKIRTVLAERGGIGPG